MKEYKTCEEVLEALRNGKKITGIGHMRRLCEGGIGCQSQHWYKILYYYCNPQMNRTFAMLENGKSVDTDIDILDFLYGKFVEYQEPSEVHEKKSIIGNTVKIAGLEWTILDKTDKGYLAITKNSIENRTFSPENNDWRSSSLREYLQSDFLKKIADDIGEDNIIPFERDLLSLDGQTEYGTCVDKVSLLTVDEYRKYRKHLPNTDKWWWLITPWSTPCNDWETSINVVSPSGVICYYDYYFSFGVRPFCIFSSAIFA